MTDNQRMADEDLRRYHEARQDLIALHREIEVIESKCNRSVRSPDSMMWDTGRKDSNGQSIKVPMSVQISKTGNKQEDLLAALADRRDYYWQQCIAAERMAYDVELRICKYCRGIHARVLSLYYICGQRLEQIAVTVNYTYRHTKRLRWQALENYGRMLAGDKGPPSPLDLC
jgi:hypothetical protein